MRGVIRAPLALAAAVAGTARADGQRMADAIHFLVPGGAGGDVRPAVATSTQDRIGGTLRPVRAPLTGAIHPPPFERRDPFAGRTMPTALGVAPSAVVLGVPTTRGLDVPVGPLPRWP